MRLAEMELTFDEGDRRTDVRASLRIGAGTFVATGRARRNPADPNRPIVGEEVATARALSNLSRQLLHAASDSICEREGRPPNLHC